MLRTRPRPAIVSAIVGMKHYETAISLLRQMEFFGIRRDVYTFSILLNCFCRLHRSDLGFSLLGKMLKLGIQPNTTTFTTLADGLCVEGKLAEAVLLFDETVRNSYKPDLITYKTIINGLCKVGYTYSSGAIRLLRKMEQSGYLPDIVT
ncbi:Pentatricopeptide repeat - like 10 [Theobroma cacao]|nr:Pentatricopeptide repeat - like 10 [Theobroma cacao]